MPTQFCVRKTEEKSNKTIKTVMKNETDSLNFSLHIFGKYK